MPLTFEQFKKLRSQGLTVDQINRFEAGEKPVQMPGEIPTGEIDVPQRSPLDIEGPDLLAFPKTAAKTGLDIARSLGRAGARPFVQLTRGIQSLVPGGKTGQEDIDIPFLGEFEGTETGLPPVKESLIEAGETLLAGKGEAILKPIFNKLGSLRNIIKDKQGRKVIQEIEDLISPKLTKRETQLASEQGRIIRGTESKLFGKQPDTVIQSGNVKKSADTIQRRIPGADKLDDQVLNTNIKTEIGNMSKSLRPGLQKINVSPDQTSRVRSAWENLKKTQAKDADFSTIPGFKQTQSNFQTFLNEAYKPVRGADGKFRAKTLDDIWDIRKRYDESIKSAVKQADNLSESSLQFKKEMWLQNRRLLNDLMEEMSQGLETTSKQSFDEMANLYRARQNIIGKTKFDEKGGRGLVSFRNLLKAGAATLGVGFVGKYLID